MKDPTQKQIEKYLKKLLCPYCKADAISLYSSMDWDGENKIFIEAECYDCHNTWLNHYTLTLTKYSF